jgi:hypothetical protein
LGVRSEAKRLLGWLVPTNRATHPRQIQCGARQKHLAPSQMLIKIIPVAKTPPGDEGCPHCITWCEQPASPSSLSFSFCFAARNPLLLLGKLHFVRTFECITRTQTQRAVRTRCQNKQQISARRRPIRPTDRPPGCCCCACGASERAKKRNLHTRPG